MAWSVRFSPAAEDEVDEAAAWYNRRSREASQRFIARIRETVLALIDDPQGLPSLDDQYRFCTLRPFPYSVVFEVRGDLVDIVAVPHDARLPGYWRGRR